MKNPKGVILKFVVLALVLFVSTLGLGAQEDRAWLWERIYRNSVNDQQRLEVLINLSDLRDSRLAPLFEESLRDLLVRGLESGSAMDVRYKTDMTRLLTRQLGDLRHVDAADALFQVYQQSPDYHVRAEAAIALGRLRDQEFAPQMTRQLMIMNNSTSRTASEAVLARGLVQGLGLMGMEEAFTSLYYAYHGWYNPASQVQEMARSAMLTLVEDPVPQFMSLLEGSTVFQDKFRALDTAVELGLPAPTLAPLCLLALEEGLRWQAANVGEALSLSRLRKLAMETYARTGERSPDVFPQLQQVVTNRYEMDETLLAVALMGRIGGEAGADNLGRILGNFNERQLNNVNNNDDLRIINQVIISLGETRHPNARPVLTEVGLLNYTPAVKRLAREALTSIP